MAVETILLVVGLLIVVTRLPFVFWPKQSFDWAQKNVFGNTRNRQVLLALLFLLSLYFLQLLFQESAEFSLKIALASFFSIILFAKSILFFLLPKFPESVFSGWRKNYEKQTPAIAVIAVIVGLALIYLGLS